MTEEIYAVRRRAPAEAVVLRRMAADTLKPLLSVLPAWQREAVHLVALARHGGHATDEQLRAAEDLVRSVETARRRFVGVVDTWPDKVAHQSRGVDMQRALDSAANAAAEARSLLALGARPRD